MITVNIAISGSTPEPVIDFLCLSTVNPNDSLRKIKLNCIDLSYKFLAKIFEASLIFDALYENSLSYQLKSDYRACSVPIIVLSEVACRYDSGTVYYAWTNMELEAEMLAKTVELLRWQQSFLVLGIDTESLYFSSLIHQYFKPKESVYASELGYGSIDRRISRVIKPLGLRFGVISAPPETSREVLKSLEKSHIAEIGYAFLLQARSIWFATTPEDTEPIFQNGLLAIAQVGMENVKSLNEFVTTTFGQLLDQLRESSDVNEFLGKNFVFSRNCQVACRKKQFGIFNLQNGSYVQVGEITLGAHGQATGARLFPNANIIYPGGTTTPPTASKAKIQISMNRSVENYGQAPSTSFNVVYEGSDIAIELIALRTDVLPNHKFIRYDYSSGAGVFHVKYAREQLGAVKSTQNFGIATIAPVTSSCTIGLLGVLEELSVDVPVLGGGSLAQILSSPKQFPNFLRLSVTVYHDFVALISYFRYNKWKKFGVIYQHDLFGIEAYQTWMNLAEDATLECLNAHEQHAVNYTISHAEEVRPQSEEIIRSQSRILIMIGTWSIFTHVFEMMYDLGARSGQYQIIVIGAVETALVQGAEASEKAYQKRREVAGGLLYLRYAVYQGEIGEQLISSGNYTATAFHCSYYDATLLSALVAQYMMTLGKEFEDAQTFKAFAQRSRFTGCQGILMFEGQVSNNRRPYLYDIVNLQEDECGEWDMVPVGKFQPASATPWVFNKPIQWTDRSVTELLDHFETQSFTCGFDENELEPIIEGQFILAGTCFLTLAATSLPILISRRSWKYASLPLLKDQKK